MAQTTAQIRNQAAQKLGLLGTGQTLQSNISSDLDQAYLEVYGMIESKGLASWGTSTTAVPDSMVEPIVAWVAGIRATRYAVDAARHQRIMLEYEGNPLTGNASAEDRLRALQANAVSPQAKIQNF